MKVFLTRRAYEALKERKLHPLVDSDEMILGLSWGRNIFESGVGKSFWGTCYYKVTEPKPPLCKFDGLEVCLAIAPEQYQLLGENCIDLIDQLFDFAPLNRIGDSNLIAGELAV